MEKKSSVNDVHKVIQKDLVELHKTLCTKLGEGNPFAKFSIGGGFYVWSDSRCQWRQMIAASSLEQSFVRSALLTTKQQVAEKLGEKTAEALFTIPDDSYVYYSNEGDDIDVLIAGWGFKKPVRVRGTGDTNEVERLNPIDISFLYDGVVLKNYEFGIQLPKQVKHLRTGLNGVYHFENLKVDEKFTLVDFATNQHILFTVLEGQSQYNYDVTRFSHVDIYANIDNAPLCGEAIAVSYNGKAYNVTTNQNGLATIDLPFYDGENISATLNGQTVNEAINANGNQLYLNFSKPKEIVDVEVSVQINSTPAANKRVVINYAYNSYEGTTNSNGILRYPVQLEDGEVCSVVVQGYETQQKPLANDNNIFLFDKTQDPAHFTPYILVKKDNGSICGKYPINVDYCDSETEYISDENGIIQLPEMEEGRLMKVIDSLCRENTSEYRLDSNQLEYIFYVNDDDRNDIQITILDVEGNPFNCNKIHLRQEGQSTELLLALDENGSTSFSKDTFLKNKELAVTILSDERKFDPIVFTLEENEDEYTLQEVTSESPWWIILLQILAILVVFVGAILMWPYIVKLIEWLFNLIYN